MSDMMDVLAQHGIYGFNGREISCGCLARGPWFTHREYSVHVAAALSAAGFGPVQEARAEAWDEGMLHGHNAEGRLLDKWESNPYRTEASS